MSYYLLHILSEGSLLRKDRGHLICAYKNSDVIRKIALEDVRGVIVAARDVAYTDAVITAILEKGGFILHCDRSYQPVGITAALTRLNTSFTALQQAKAEDALNQRLWEKLVKGKVSNQIRVLAGIKAETRYLKEQIAKPVINESACARWYWRAYFDSLGYEELTRRGDADHKVNGMLNYGYAVLTAICHRSLVAHGLSPLLGVHHKPVFHGNPLVYDLVEPWRPFIDNLLHRHLRDNPFSDIKAWAVFSRHCWEGVVTINENNRQKLVDTVDYYMATLVKAYAKKQAEELWLPEVIFAD